MNKLFLLLLTMILTACSLISPSSEISQNETKWQDANVTHYRFRLGVSCFCPVGDRMPMSVEVRDGEIVSITDVNGAAFETSDPLNELVMKYATIDRIFAELQSDEVREADKLTAAYDSSYGFPTEVAIDFIEQAIDDELYLSISAFEPLN